MQVSRLACLMTGDSYVAQARTLEREGVRLAGVYQSPSVLQTGPSQWEMVVHSVTNPGLPSTPANNELSLATSTDGLIFTIAQSDFQLQGSVPEILANPSIMVGAASGMIRWAADFHSERDDVLCARCVERARISNGLIAASARPARIVPPFGVLSTRRAANRSRFGFRSEDASKMRKLHQ